MAEINKINIGGVEYDIAGSGSSGGNGITTIDKTIEYDENDNSFVVFTEDELNLLYSNTGTIVNLFATTTAEEPVISVSPIKPPLSNIYGIEGEHALLSLYGRVLHEDTELWTRLDQSSEDPLKFIVLNNFCAPFESVCCFNMPEDFTTGDSEYVLIEDELLTGYALAFYQQPLHTIGIKTSNEDTSEVRVIYLSLVGHMMDEDMRVAVYTNEDAKLGCYIMASIQDGPEAIGVLTYAGEN